MKDLGCVCVWLCRGIYFLSQNIGWTFCVQEMYFFSNPSAIFFSVTFAIWGMGRYKKRNVRLFEVSILSACRTVLESMRIIKTTLTFFFLHLNFLHLTRLDPLLPRVVLQMARLKKKCSHTFVFVFRREFRLKSFCLSCLWDSKGKAPASYQKLC